MDFFIKIDNLAKKALTYEVLLSPKPGLVDRYDNGAHSDMDIYSFMDSIFSLDDYLYECVKAGYEFSGERLSEILKIIRPLGIEAEARMLDSTDGVNTHKGAIFIFGILCAAIGHEMSIGNKLDFNSISRSSALICEDILDDFNVVNSDNLTYGTSQYKNLGLTGIRGEAKSGFPSIEKSLDIFKKTIEDGYNEKVALGESLLFLMTFLDDSNVIGRTGLEGLSILKLSALEIIKSGGYRSAEGILKLSEANEEFKSLRISPGGCADLASATLFIYWVERISVS